MILSHLNASELKISQNLGISHNPFLALGTGAADALAKDFDEYLNNSISMDDFHDNHRINISVNWFESDDTAVAQAYRDQKDKLTIPEKEITGRIGFKEIMEIHDHQSSLIKHSMV